MPLSSRIEDAEEAGESRGPVRRTLQTDYLGFSDGLRMTLVVLFALLGWPRPTHGKDPGAAAARPWKLELLNVISKLHIPAATAGRLAARRPAPEFAEKIGANLASAA